MKTQTKPVQLCKNEYNISSLGTPQIYMAEARSVPFGPLMRLLKGAPESKIQATLEIPSQNLSAFLDTYFPESYSGFRFCDSYSFNK